MPTQADFAATYQNMSDGQLLETANQGGLASEIGQGFSLGIPRPATNRASAPGVCFLTTSERLFETPMNLTARVRKLTLVTRDSRILDLAKSEPNYLSVVPLLRPSQNLVKPHISQIRH